MPSFSAQKDFAISLHLKSGDHWRGQCPFCNGVNTLSVSNFHGKLLWNCYRASCDSYGASQGVLGKHEIAKLLYAKEDQNQLTEYLIPEWWQHIADTGSSSIMLDWLKRHSVWEMAHRKLMDIMWDPKLNRVVLIKKVDGKAQVAIGYSLNTEIKPKWYKYTQYATMPFVIDPGSDVAVVVEDVPSAATVAAGGLAGISLMGTTIVDSYIPYMVNYDLVIIALDKDASQKSLELQKRVKMFTPAVVKMLEMDLKWHAPQDIVRELSVPSVYKLVREG